MAVQAGNYVEVVDREPNPADAKSGLFYNHFRGLRGSVDRVYADGNVSVVVDHATLTRDMLVRLKRAERVIKPRWKNAGSPDPEPEPAPAVTAAAETGDDEADEGEIEEQIDERDRGIGASARAAAEATAQAEALEDAAELKVNPGLRYSIVLKPEDVRVLDGSTRHAAGPPVGARTDLPPTRMTEEQLRAAEALHMEELNRARKR